MMNELNICVALIQKKKQIIVFKIKAFNFNSHNNWF